MSYLFFTFFSKIFSWESFFLQPPVSFVNNILRAESVTSPSVPNSQYARNEAQFMRGYYRRKHEESLRKQPRRSMKVF